MGEINIPRDQQDALAGIDLGELDKLIEQSIRYEQSGDLCSLPLKKCGSYVAKQFYRFEQALMKHHVAKASRKREETGGAVRRAARDLIFAVGAMKQRMETEQKEGQFFFIYDQIVPPFRFNKQLKVRVSYRWRSAEDKEWTYGSITFVHDVEVRSEYTKLAPKKKLSAAKLEDELQNRLSQTWEYLVRDALFSVRDYFRSGGEVGGIPEIFRVSCDNHSGLLNNSSTQFWQK
jgi:hypothetical protein